MALDFGMLQPANIAGNIMAGRQEAQRNQLAQQQLAMGGLQQQKAQLELGDFQRRQAGLDKFIQQAKQNGKTGSEEDLANNYYEYALNIGDPQHIMHAQELLMGVNERKRFNQEQMGGQPLPPVTAAPPAADFPVYDRTGDSLLARQAALEAPVTAQAPFIETRNLPARGVELPPATPAPVINNLSAAAAAPVAPVNQLAAPAVMSPAEIQARIKYLSQFKPERVPAAKAEIAMLTKQLEEAFKAHTVAPGGALVVNGKEIYKAAEKITPSETAKLLAERQVLIDKNPKDPNIAVYDQKIKDEGLGREKLNFEKQVHEWKVNHPGYSIQQDENGYLVGVDPHTLQGSYVTFGKPAVGGGGKAGKPGAFPSANVQGTPSVLPPAAAVQAAPGAAPAVSTDGMPAPGERMKGKTAGLTESQGNATAYGMRMKESHGLLKDLESKGETGTGVIRGTVGGVVGLVPLIGDKLTAGTDNIFTVLPSILGGMSPEQQQIQNARINFITAVLRKESGAAISPGEFITAEKLYFPQPGNDPSVIKQKQKARELAIKAMEIQAGPGAKSIQSLTPGTSGENKNVITHPSFPGFSIGTK